MYDKSLVFVVLVNSTYQIKHWRSNKKKHEYNVSSEMNRCNCNVLKSESGEKILMQCTNCSINARTNSMKKTAKGY